ncbi:MAG: gamma-butyrobetaine hydroxylase-like domain-containing protein [Chloroflexota bacterium]
MTPVEIVADRAAGTIAITWDDGHHSLYPTGRLRWACPCATCAGEWGRPGRLESLTVLPDEELTLVDVHAVGTYAISPIWASGHSSGIYSFEYLRELCDCRECTDAQIPLD